LRAEYASEHLRVLTEADNEHCSGAGSRSRGGNRPEPVTQAVEIAAQKRPFDPCDKLSHFSASLLNRSAAYEGDT